MIWKDVYKRQLLLCEDLYFILVHKGGTGETGSLQLAQLLAQLLGLRQKDVYKRQLFERIYEDNVSGKISDERFSRMSRRYEDEQKELTEKIKQHRSEIEKPSSRTMRCV